MSHDVVFFPFSRSVRFAAYNQFICWNNSKLGEGIYKPVQCWTIMGIRWKLYCQVVATNVPTKALEVEEKEEQKNLRKRGEFYLYVMVDCKNFHMSKK